MTTHPPWEHPQLVCEHRGGRQRSSHLGTKMRMAMDEVRARPLLLSPLPSSLVHPGSQRELRGFLLCCSVFLSCSAAPGKEQRRA